MDYAPVDTCQLCGARAPTRQTTFHQNVGMLVARQSKTLNARMCKACVNSNYWKMTGITLAVGWLGTISLVLAPIYVITNTATYLGRLGMGKADAG